MDNAYIKTRKQSLQAEFDANTEQLTKLQARQVWLQGAFAELSTAETTSDNQSKEKKVTK